MYRISVPITIENMERVSLSELAETLRSLDAIRLMIGIGVYETDPQSRQKKMADIKRYCEFFHAEGFEVCAWTWSFWVNPPHSYTSITAVREQETTIVHEVCPADPEFVAFASDYLAEVAACGVDMILFDDDFRYAVLEGGNIGCLCKHHIDMIAKRTGESLTREELTQKILSGGKNKFRDAWLQSNGEALENFARAVRAKIDTVAPQTRIGLCACISAWDMDGTSAGTLAHLLAGSHTKPFLRLIGAPYWAARNSWGCMMQDVVELSRMESSWSYDGEIEILAEGDCYPRPRINCPASYLEGFDLAMRASGTTDGILKYALDYVSSLQYEQGYIRFHHHNKPIYGQMDRFFANKKACGVRVYEFPQKIAEMELGETPVDPNRLSLTFFSASSRSLSACSIPTTYEGTGVCGAAFGENARYLTPEMRRNGMILDAEAAKILHLQGIDVGIRALGRSYETAIEYFPDLKEYVPTEGASIYDHEFSESIRMCSVSKVSDKKTGLSHDEILDAESKRVPVSYLYENAAGERYLVLNFDARFKGKQFPSIIMRHYARSRQYAEAVEWLSHGKKLPAYSYGNPNLYIMAKQGEGCMTVGLWNFFADQILTPTVKLDREYREIRFLNCDGSLDGDTVTLSALPAYGFAAFEVLDDQ